MKKKERASDRLIQFRSVPNCIDKLNNPDPEKHEFEITEIN